MKGRNMKSSKKTLKSTPSSTEIDRLSNLPDELLLHILSFLDMDSVIQTTVLSKRWRYVWSITSVLPSLNFDYVTFLNRRLVGDHQLISDKYINFIDKVLCLLHKSSSSIHRFRLSYISSTSSRKKGFMAEEGARIKKLHQILDETLLECNNTESKIQELVLEIHKANYQVSECIYSCNPSLTTLKLEGIKLNLNLLDVSVVLPCLKTLCLKWVEIEEDESGISFGKFISSCPVLQTLVFSDSSIRNTNDITISSVSLENLKIEYIRWQVQGPCKVTIDAPNLVSFKSRNIEGCNLVWRRKSASTSTS